MNTSLKTRLHNLSTTHLCDTQNKLKVLDSTIKALCSKYKFSGRAFTVKSEGDLLPVIKAVEALHDNAVLLIDTNASQDAVFGEIFTTAAKNKNVQAIIIDGYCRDISDIEKLGVPLYARGVTPRAGSKNKPGMIQVEINIGGLVIQPDEIVFGDENGVIFFKENDAEILIVDAEQIKYNEEKVLEKVRNGDELNEALNLL